MKQTILTGVILLWVGMTHAQKLKESEIPAAVKAAFAKSFPSAKNIEWSKEGASEFEVEYKNGSKEQATNYDKDGKWLVTETEIKKGDLPAPVLATLNKDFAGYDLEEIEKAETPDSLFYELEVEKGKLTYEVQIAADGKLIKKSEKKEDKD